MTWTENTNHSDLHTLIMKHPETALPTITAAEEAVADTITERRQGHTGVLPGRGH